MGATNDFSVHHDADGSQSTCAAAIGYPDTNVRSESLTSARRQAGSHIPTASRFGDEKAHPCDAVLRIDDGDWISQAAGEPKRPNIVLMIADDMAWDDCRCLWKHEGQDAPYR